MKNNILKIAAIAILIIAFSSCRKDESSTPTETKSGSVLLEFFNKVGTENLKMDGTSYKNQNGDDFTVTKFNYYISNIKLNNADGSSFAETESYHLLEQSSPSSLNFSVAGVPSGTYKSITFTIGVDSLHNVSGAQSGALDPVNGMFWSWTNGYIMLKLEGSSPQSTQADNKYQLHVGGFKGIYNTVRTISLTMPNTIIVNGDENHIHISADIQKLLGNPNPVKFAKNAVIMSSGIDAKALADNYEGMFSITAAGK